MVKLKSDKKYTKGLEIKLPIVGVVKFDSSNCIELEDDDKLEQLLKLEIGFKLIRLDQLTDEEVKEEEQKEMSRLTKKQLVNILKESGVDPSEIYKLKNKAEIIAYIEKLQS